LYIINQKSKVPLHIQLFNEVKKDIICNLKIGDKLQSIRKVATTYNLSKNTVQNAYSQLYAEGYIDSYTRSGYYVSDMNYEKLSPAIIKKENENENKNNIQYKYNFFPVRLSKDTFPLKLWKRLSSKALDESLDFGTYLDGQGELGLRQQIAKYLINSRAVNCDASNIVVCNGFPEAMGIVAKMLHNKHSSLAIESPGYSITKKVFEDYGYDIENIAINENGLELEQLAKAQSRLVYITPSHQYPTAVTMPISNRLKLLKWAKQTNAFIIEDDYDSELSYVNRPIPSLQGLDNNDRTIYFGTFSKSLSAALRVCYIVLPSFLTKIYQASYDSHFPKVSLSTQKTLELFLKGGHYEKHIRKIRTLNRKKHNILKQNLQKYLKNTFKFETQGSGLSILINPTVAFDMQKLKDLAIKNEIKLYFASDITNGQWQAIRMGFGGFLEDEIEEAVNAFSKIWFLSIKE
jgi:GntR family transcriptional regulator/MocR family aminotransferase